MRRGSSREGMVILEVRGQVYFEALNEGSLLAELGRERHHQGPPVLLPPVPPPPSCSSSSQLFLLLEDYWTECIPSLLAPPHLSESFVLVIN